MKNGRPSGFLDSDSNFHYDDIAYVVHSHYWLFCNLVY